MSTVSLLFIFSSQMQIFHEYLTQEMGVNEYASYGLYFCKILSTIDSIINSNNSADCCHRPCPRRNTGRVSRFLFKVELQSTKGKITRISLFLLFIQAKVEPKIVELDESDEPVGDSGDTDKKVRRRVRKE